jgi:hypothetical protein
MDSALKKHPLRVTKAFTIESAIGPLAARAISLVRSRVVPKISMIVPSIKLQRPDYSRPTLTHVAAATFFEPQPLTDHRIV